MILNTYGTNCDGWESRHPRATIDMLGFLPNFIDANDKRSAVDQIKQKYGGSWRSDLFSIDKKDIMCYPGDPPYMPLYELKREDERIILYEHEIVAVIKPDGSFRTARID